ncbi:DUF4266 domain-containing protein [Permianibacter sp. IMCC34836]|nr:DUF4266 domain-containing protein [Permianibacter fluminis]
MNRSGKFLLRVATLAGLLSLSACSVEPWLKPYERQNLADPIMAFERDAVQTAYINHVYQAREGARGAEGGGGGGCGCN